MNLLIFNELNKILKEYNFNKINFTVTKPSNNEFGDFSTNISMILAKTQKKKPNEIAEMIVEKFNKDKTLVKKIQIVSPGFINFYLVDDYYSKIVERIIEEDLEYGKDISNLHYNLEFVSANPTGFLHVAHARGAALGDSLANILEYVGVKVTREYYINDGGSQIDMLAYACYVRYLQLFDIKVDLPEESYHGQDIIWCAKQIKEKVNDSWVNKEYEVIKEQIKELATEIMLVQIKKDLESMKVNFDIYFSEKSLYKGSIIKNKLKEIDGVVVKDGATWLKTTDHGDDKDRVLIKQDGSYTYFLPDIIYHNIKITRDKNISKLINIWGADHSGYIKRMEIAMGLMGHKGQLEIIVLQLVKLLKNGEELKMSKRKGTSLYLSELVKQVGVDTTRFFLVNRSPNSQIDFDLDLANMKTNDNPVFIVQYAYARTQQLIKKSKFKKFKKLDSPTQKEKDLVGILEQFPAILKQIASNNKVHLLPQYLITLAKEFNSFYSNSKILGNIREEEMVALVKACSIVIKIGLSLLGVSTPERM
ncbi:MAG: arginine--tRNA ligase [Metamycoplasmataceae bacterium]